MKLLAGLMVVVAACGGPQSASSTDPDRRGAYVGGELGTEVDPATTPPTVVAGIAMPEGMTRGRAFHATTEDIHVVIGLRGPDVIVFLTDDDGTVTDDFTLPGHTATHGFTASCSRAGILVAMVPTAACASGEPGAQAAPTHAWTHKAGKLVEAPTAGLTCDCFTTQPE